MAYLVSGNNLFGQWFPQKRIIDKFEATSQYTNNNKTNDILQYATLVKICWSYNIFQRQQKIFTTGYCDDEKFTQYVFDNCQTDPADLLATGGDLFTEIPPNCVDTSHCKGKICDVVCGYGHYMLLTNAGFVYTWGSSLRLQLGHGDTEYVNKPKEIDALAGLQIFKIAAGGFHSIALSNCGDVYVWGSNEEGQLGIPQKEISDDDNILKYSLPKLIDILDEKDIPIDTNVTDVACGSKHSVIKLEDNTIWATGYNKYGQLGISPEKYPLIKQFRMITKCDFDFDLMCGNWCTVIKKRCKSNI
ncbi:RCC1 domain-containing protein 1 isoform X2 [Battus philenor]|uniref:RCC1 domain-containing protein 1 isoform X2 n=1 Tax=Battus philenor TaxID=42288 RepID=UPI0035D10FB3